MKDRQIMADPLKFSAALATSVITLPLAMRSFLLGYPIAGIIFVIIAVIFLYIMVMYGSVLKITQIGVSRVFLFFTLDILLWDQIKEVGVVGTKVFNGISKNRKPGRRYIYISPEEMDEDSRFKMALEWPPRKGTMYCLYSRPNIDAIQFRWQKHIESYNAGDIFFE